VHLYKRDFYCQIFTDILFLLRLQGCRDETVGTGKEKLVECSQRKRRRGGEGEKERTRVIQGVKSELDIVPVKSGRFGPGRVLHISASVGCSPVYNA